MEGPLRSQAAADARGYISPAPGTLTTERVLTIRPHHGGVVLPRFPQLSPTIQQTSIGVRAVAA